MTGSRRRGAVFLFRQPRPSIAKELEDDDAPRTIKQTGLGAQIMSTMGLYDLILLTDSPDTRYLGLDAYGISITGTRPLSIINRNGERDWKTTASTAHAQLRRVTT